MNYLKVLPIDLRYEIYCFFEYEELAEMARNDDAVKDIVYTERFLNRKSLDIYECNSTTLKIIYEMLSDGLLEIKQHNANRPANKYTLIGCTSNENISIKLEAPDIYSTLYDFLQYYMKDRKQSREYAARYGRPLIGSGLEIFSQSLMSIGQFSLTLLIEYVKKIATNPYSPFWVRTE
jgi:hypothetical protein